MVDPQLHTFGRKSLDLLGPLHRDHSPIVPEKLVESDALHRLVSDDSIRVEVAQRHLRTAMLDVDDERRTADRVPVETESVRQPANQARLSGTELAVQREDHRGFEYLAEDLTDPMGGLLVVTLDSDEMRRVGHMDEV